MLLPPACRDGDRLGYPPVEANTARLLAGAEDLGLDADALTKLAAAWREAECPTARQRLAEAVTGRLELVQATIGERQRLMADSGPGTGEWAAVTKDSVPLYENAARLQAVAGALAGASHTGPCGDACGCGAALAAPAMAYRFPADPAAGEAALLCDLSADGGDAHDRIGVWQQVLTRVQRRDPPPGVDGGTQTGLMLRFQFDVELAATLGRLAAAELYLPNIASVLVGGTFGSRPRSWPAVLRVLHVHRRW